VLVIVILFISKNMGASSNTGSNSGSNSGNTGSIGNTSSASTSGNYSDSSPNPSFIGSFSGNNSGIGSGNNSGGFKLAHCLYSEDLIPFLRNAMFIVAESPSSSCLLTLEQHYNVPFLALCSPASYPEQIPEITSTGSLFTFFLHSPLDAFCFSVNQTDLLNVTYISCQEICEKILADIKNMVHEEKLAQPCMAFLNDPLLAVLIYRFIFCCNVLQLHVHFQKSPIYLPSSNPPLPNGMVQNKLIQSKIKDLANVLGVGKLFSEKKQQ